MPGQPRADAGTEAGQEPAAAGAGPELVFEPRDTMLNDEVFTVEVPPTCNKAYDLEHISIESYWGDTPYDDIPWDEVDELFTHRFVGYDKTIVVHLMRVDRPVWPTMISVDGTGPGYHRAGAVTVDGVAIIARWIVIEPTPEEVRARIEVARRAIRAVREADGARVAGADAGAGAAAEPAVQAPAGGELAHLPEADVCNEWRQIRLPDGSELDVGGRRTRRRHAVKGIWEHCQRSASKRFEWKTLKETIGVKSDRLLRDLFKEQRMEALKIFEVVGAATDERYALKVKFHVT